MIEKLEINYKIWHEHKYYLDYDYSIKSPYSFSSNGVVDFTGWASPDRLLRLIDLEDTFLGPRYWYLHGYPSSAQEVFDSLTDEQKEEAIWELDEWK